MIAPSPTLDDVRDGCDETLIFSPARLLVLVSPRLSASARSPSTGEPATSRRPQRCLCCMQCESCDASTVRKSKVGKSENRGRGEPVEGQGIPTGLQGDGRGKCCPLELLEYDVGVRSHSGSRRRRPTFAPPRPSRISLSSIPLSLPLLTLSSTRTSSSTLYTPSTLLTALHRPPNSSSRLTQLPTLSPLKIKMKTSSALLSTLALASVAVAQLPSSAPVRFPLGTVSRLAS